MPLLPLCSQVDVGATVNSLLGDTFSRENNTHGSRFHDRDPQFASRILGAMTQSCYIGTRDIRSRVIRGPYCNVSPLLYVFTLFLMKPTNVFSFFYHSSALKMEYAVEITPYRRKRPDYLSLSIPLLLVVWCRKAPGHQQPWYCPGSPGTCPASVPEGFLPNFLMLSSAISPSKHLVQVLLFTVVAVEVLHPVTYRF